MSNNPSESSAIQTHLKAAKELLAACLHRIKVEDPEAYQGAAGAMRHGASVRITTALSVAGLCEVDVALVDGVGNVLNLASAAFDPITKH